MDECNPESCDKEPDNVKQSKKTTGHIPFVDFKCPAEWPEAERTDLDHLKTKGDTDDGCHHNDTPREISYCSGEATKQKPDYISQEIHYSLIIPFRIKIN